MKLYNDMFGFIISRHDREYVIDSATKISDSFSRLQIRIYSLLYPQAPTHVVHLEEAPSSIAWSPARPLVLSKLTFSVEEMVFF